MRRSRPVGSPGFWLSMESDEGNVPFGEVREVAERFYLQGIEVSKRWQARYQEPKGSGFQHQHAEDIIIVNGGYGFCMT